MVVDFTEGLLLSGVEEFRISRTINAPLARVCDVEEKTFFEGREDCKAGWSGTFDNLDTHFAKE